MAKPNRSTLSLVWRLLTLMKTLLPWIILAVGFAVMGFVITVSIPTGIAYLGLLAIRQEVIPILALYLLIALAFLRGFVRYGEHYFGHFVAFHSLAAFRNLIFKKLRALSPACLDSQDSGYLLKMIGEDIEALEVFFAHTIAPICTAILSASLMFWYFCQSSWQLALLALATYACLAIVIPIYFANILQVLLKSQNEGRKDYLSYFLESLRSVKDLLQFQVLDEQFERLIKKSNHVNALDRNVAQAQFLQMALTFFWLGLMILAFSYMVFDGICHDSLSFDKGLLTFIAFTASFSPFLELGRLPLGFKRAMNAARNIFDLLDENVIVDEGTKQIDRLRSVSFEDLSFAYPKRQELVFKDLSVTFQEKGIIGIKGESGSGKSTLVKLIMKWYNWKTGDIFLNDRNSCLLNAAKLQDTIAYVPQTAQLFQQSIRENLTFGRQDISDESIWNLAEACGMKDRLLACKEGLDTIIKSPSDFSAGEGQRLELMRALLKDASCYIFDEPTSNLDSLNEAILLDLIKTHCQGLVFLISHRPSTLACADHLFCVKNGFLKEVNKK
ncbi:TPA: amino acid ABC transporter ATP-binding/permease protein [Streptococcus pyogenes]|uniref:amino acid ABC transporter ATP-binding/permease protein n=1 Tax=Streptococcus pyogenes TaxID=1314 RepID=UPI000252E7B8|nr:ABC transporter ATP-binding protein [Streptococcus pyogenes]HER4563104.1 ABC transporter ATP-binding protein [Streptococcus pyogenes NGAS639]HER4697217.1 ABC transporter ATP-binding protein [Streptococcus pyogenes NGAS339]HER4708830.1 ABC transporter ATP-binding protein [Streptococcus pyogenes NGAS321]AFC66694.1 ABC transport system fused ATP-binding and permease component [Streptococcus pyogenes MGAS15252]AFC68623.1 ABC transport system fused ATP-binding and permease component [Streptococc